MTAMTSSGYFDRVPNSCAKGEIYNITLTHVPKVRSII